MAKTCLVEILLILSASWCIGDSRRQFRITIGIYSLDDTWENVVRHVWYSDANNVPFAEELIYMKYNYPPDLQGINAARKHLEETQLTVLVGPYNMALQLASNDLAIPYLVTTLPLDAVNMNHTYYLLPQDEVMHIAVIDVMQEFKWKKVGIIYDSHQGLHMMADVLEYGNNTISVQGWRVGSNEGIPQLRKKLIAIREQRIFKVVLVCRSDTIKSILEIALQLSMLSNIYSWIPMTLNPILSDYNQYNNSLVILTAFELQSINETRAPADMNVLQYVSAFDAHSLITTAASNYATLHDCYTSYCNISIPDFNEQLKQITYDSTSSHITFTANNHRNHTMLSVLSLSELGLQPIGDWDFDGHDRKTRLSIPARNRTFVFNSDNRFGSRTMKVVLIRDPPFVMYSNDYQNKKGKARFEGFLLDLMAELSKRLKFTYDIYEVPDLNYGSKQDDGTWNGMIRELIDAKADMCLGAISITSEREEVVDFTKPFMQRSYNLLVKKPREKSSIFQFLWPLSEQVWLLTISSLIVLGFLLFIMDRISPNSPDPHCRFNLKESIWFIYGSLVGAGTEMVPRTISGRILSGSWWFFSLILISSYTANLAAFLTVTKINTPINSLQDLVTQTEIKYGTVRNTNAHSFFRTSKLEIFRKMWSHIEVANGLVNDSSVGLERVKSGGYAFIWDTPVNRYMTMTECDVMTVGDPFDQKGYGIGVPRGVSYGEELSVEILKINEDGIIQALEEKWWSGGKCEEFRDTQTGRTKELDFLNVAGVFLVLSCGVVLAFVICLIEFFYITLRRKSKMEKQNRALSLDNEREATELHTTLCNSHSNSEAPPIVRKNKRSKSWLFQ